MLAVQGSLGRVAKTLAFHRQPIARSSRASAYADADEGSPCKCVSTPREPRRLSLAAGVRDRDNLGDKDGTRRNDGAASYHAPHPPAADRHNRPHPNRPRGCGKEKRTEEGLIKQLERTGNGRTTSATIHDRGELLKKLLAECCDRENEKDGRAAFRRLFEKRGLGEMLACGSQHAFKLMDVVSAYDMLCELGLLPLRIDGQDHDLPIGALDPLLRTVKAALVADFGRARGCLQNVSTSRLRRWLRGPSPHAALLRATLQRFCATLSAAASDRPFGSWAALVNTGLVKRAIASALRPEGAELAPMPPSPTPRAISGRPPSARPAVPDDPPAAQPERPAGTFPAPPPPSVPVFVNGSPAVGCSVFPAPVRFLQPDRAFPMFLRSADPRADARLPNPIAPQRIRAGSFGPPFAQRLAVPSSVEPGTRPVFCAYFYAPDAFPSDGPDEAASAGLLSQPIPVAPTAEGAAPIPPPSRPPGSSAASRAPSAADPLASAAAPPVDRERPDPSRATGRHTLFGYDISQLLARPRTEADRAGCKRKATDSPSRADPPAKRAEHRPSPGAMPGFQRATDPSTVRRASCRGSVSRS